MAIVVQFADMQCYVPVVSALVLRGVRIKTSFAPSEVLCVGVKQAMRRLCMLHTFSRLAFEITRAYCWVCVVA